MLRIKAKPISYSSVKRKKSDVWYIVIHYTGCDKDTAENEGKYFAYSNNRKAGAHFFIGQNGTIVKSIDLNRIAWAVGGGKYSDCAKTGGGSKYGIVTNANSVSIELCDNLNRYPSLKQIEAVKKTIKYIRKKCPNAKTVVRHFDVTGKHCPANMMDNKMWKAFKKSLGEEE